MQAIPYRSWVSTTTTTTTTPTTTATAATTIDESTTAAKPNIKNLVSENAVIVFGRRGCCMCHVVKLLLLGLGVNPTIAAIDDNDNEANSVINELSKINGNEDDGECTTSAMVNFPAVFIGGKFFGGLERVMATHISGELVPILKDAGALWL